MDIKEMKMDLGGREFKITNGPIQTYASGYALVSLGDVTVMANIGISEKGKQGAAWFPMFVDYEENYYASGKIKGSRFVKRPGRPSENAVLTSRLIDRPIRPLFPKGAINEVQIICTVLSSDQETNPATTAMNAASVALMLSGAEFAGPIGAVRVGYLNDELILNPTYAQCEEGVLDLVVAGTLDAITMVEASAKEVPEDVFLKALDFAHKYIKEICQMQIDYVAKFEVEPIKFEVVKPEEVIFDKVKVLLTDEMLDGIAGKTKKDVKKKIHALEDMIFEKLFEELENEETSEGEIANILNTLFEKRMRHNILTKGLRIDGRKLDEVRPITVVPDVLPRVHGSALFQRGETMSLTITTLAGPGAAQIVDIMDMDIEKRYMHHYRFPPYAVGDIKPLRGASRRDIGHGDLGERALIPVLPTQEDFGYTMLLVSEITRCNGSSSMAGVCGSTLSLMCAGVPIKRPVSGIAMGLVSDEKTGDYKILTDIQGMEDFAGDMDFKVTGTEKGITALQMDIKIKGLSLDLLEDAFSRAKEGRMFILNEMLKVVPEVRTELSEFAPSIETMTINPDFIKVVIGKGGETIQKITKECEVEIDINDEGIITITSPDKVAGAKAKEWIERITYVPKVGDVFDGKVVRLMDFGAFVEIVPGKDGLVHISELANERVNKVEDVVKMGDALKVKLIKIDDQGRLNLSHKATLGAGGDKGGVPAHKDSRDALPKGKIVDGTSSVREV